MSYALLLWTVVAMAGDRHGQTEKRDWRVIAEFNTIELCKDAARELNVIERYRCVRSK